MDKCQYNDLAYITVFRNTYSLRRVQNFALKYVYYLIKLKYYRDFVKEAVNIASVS